VVGENVAAEVAARVAPDGVDVVGAALGVVVLDQKPRTLDPVVVRSAQLGAASPGEMQRGAAGPVIFACSRSAAWSGRRYW
jgi:hypothetical protein